MRRAASGAPSPFEMLASQAPQGEGIGAA